MKCIVSPITMNQLRKTTRRWIEMMTLGWKKCKWQRRSGRGECRSKRLAEYLVSDCEAHEAEWSKQPSDRTSMDVVPDNLATYML